MAHMNRDLNAMVLAAAVLTVYHKLLQLSKNHEAKAPDPFC